MSHNAQGDGDCTLHAAKIGKKRMTAWPQSCDAVGQDESTCQRSVPEFSGRGSSSHSCLMALSLKPSRTKMCFSPSSTWNPVTMSSELLICCSLLRKNEQCKPMFVPHTYIMCIYTQMFGAQVHICMYYIRLLD